VKDKPTTYGDLFAILVSLGFRQKPAGSVRAEPSVFFHEQTDTILAFSRDSDELVTPADMLSTEVHLHGKGIVDEPLQCLVGAIPAKTGRTSV
jgi:hypothetical protein